MIDHEPSVPAEGDLREILEELLAETDIPGISVVVSVRGIRLSAHVGRAATNFDHSLSSRSRFEVSCLMKMFVALVVLEYAANGRIFLDAPITEYLPELAKGDTTQPILVRHLLSHTGGYFGLDISDARTKWAYNWQKFVDHFKQAGTAFPAGSVFNYEHTEHVVLGELIRRVSGKSAAIAVQRDLLDHLGITTGCSSTDMALDGVYVGQHRYDRTLGRFIQSNLPPFGQFWEASLPDWTLTLEQQITFAEAMCGSFNRSFGASPLSTSTLSLATQPVITLPNLSATGIMRERTPRAFSLACGYYRLSLFGHNGSMPGQSCAVRFAPTSRFAISVGIPAYAPYARDAAIDRTFALCLGRPRMLPRPNASRRRLFSFESLAGGHSMAEMAGIYRGSFFGEARVTVQDGVIACALGRESRDGVTIKVRREGPYHCTLESSAPTSIGFVRHPQLNEPTLIIGVHAYKKIN